jgi:hypothetical protein
MQGCITNLQVAQSSIILITKKNPSNGFPGLNGAMKTGHVNPICTWRELWAFDRSEMVMRRICAPFMKRRHATYKF